jgi:hypothetical protein
LSPCCLQKPAWFLRTSSQACKALFFRNLEFITYSCVWSVEVKSVIPLVIRDLNRTRLPALRKLCIFWRLSVICQTYFVNSLTVSAGTASSCRALNLSYCLNSSQFLLKNCRDMILFSITRIWLLLRHIFVQIKVPCSIQQFSFYSCDIAWSLNMHLVATLITIT